MKRISVLLCALLALLMSQSALSTGTLFNVSTTGVSGQVDISLCLNALKNH